MSNQKRLQSITSTALDLIESAYSVANTYTISRDFDQEVKQQVYDGLVYAYILAGLRFSPDYLAGYDPREVVHQAMKIEYGMSTEEFATTILGG